MDNPKPPSKPEHLLNDLESIRRLLEPEHAEPPLLTDSIDPQSIPLLSDIVTPPPAARPKTLVEQITSSTVTRAARTPSVHPEARELNRLEGELRAAAQHLLQDVIDDFVPQIEAELQRRLETRLDLLLAQRKRGAT